MKSRASRFTREDIDAAARKAFEKAMHSIAAAQLDIVPKECRTVRQWAALMRLSRAQADRYLKLMLEEGRAGRCEFRILAGSLLRRVPHYWLK